MRSDYAQELNIIEQRIADFLDANNVLRQLMPFAVKKGKRIRSILYLMNWNKNALVDAEIKYKTIALIELIHFGSILHDDVIDNNMVRRNLNSVAKEFGFKKSIIWGDLLLVYAINELLKLHANDTYIKNYITEQCCATALGAALERDLNIQSTIQDCINIMSLKTASLFKLVFVLSSQLSHSSAQLDFAYLGNCFGLLFQFQNDLDSFSLSDFRASEDFMQKNITLPTILLKEFLNFDLSKFCLATQKIYLEIQHLLQTPEFKSGAQKIFSESTLAVEDFLYASHPTFSFRC